MPVESYKKKTYLAHTICRVNLFKFFTKYVFKKVIRL